MKNNYSYRLPIFLLTIFATAVVSFTLVAQSKTPQQKQPLVQDSLKKYEPTQIIDLPVKEIENENLQLIKKNGHASYYADKFTGRRTASGRRFDNNKYTCASKTLPFGTKLKVTNTTTKKSVIVEVTDRGPYVRGRDIDLSKRAFMDIAPKTYGGSILVTIEKVIK